MNDIPARTIFAPLMVAVIGLTLVQVIDVLRKRDASAVLGGQGIGVWPGGYEDPTIMAFKAIDPAYNGSGPFALGEPDGLPAIIYGGAVGNYLSLGIFDAPTYVKTVKVYLQSLYPYVTAYSYRVDVSADGVNWIEGGHGPQIEPGATVYEQSVGQTITAMRIYIPSAGVSIGVDAVEAVKF